MDGGGATTEKHLLRGQKSTNQLKALLANLLPAAEGVGGEECAATVEALLSDISDSLSQALASLRFGASYGQQQLPAPPGQGHLNSVAGGGRRSTSRRVGQRMRDGVCPTIKKYDMEIMIPYTWRKYGQKDILGAKFAGSYFKCAHKSDLGCCSAKKQVQQSDADPSVLEVTYIGAHTCDQPSASRPVPGPIRSGEQRTGGRRANNSANARRSSCHRRSDRHGLHAVDGARASIIILRTLASVLAVGAAVGGGSHLIAPGDPPVQMELKLSDRHVVVSDSVVPEL